MANFRFQQSAHVSAYRAAQADAHQERAARNLADAAAAYAGKRSDWNRFQLCNAIIDLIEDGDALAERETLMDYLRIDEDGNPVRDDSPNDTFWRDSFHAINAGMGEAA